MDINIKCWAFCSWMRNRLRGWTAFLVLWSGRMPCFELRFFLIWSRKGALVSLAEPAVAEAAGCYDNEIIFCELQIPCTNPQCCRKQSHANLASPCCGAAFFPMSCLFLQWMLLLITEEALPSSPASVTMCPCSPDSDNIREYPVDSE